MNKRIISVLFGILLVLSLVACGSNEVTTTKASSDGETTVAVEVTEDITIAVQDITTETTQVEAAEETESALDGTTEEATTEEIATVSKNALLTVEQTDDISGIGYGKVFNAATEEYAFYAVFRTDVKITDIKVLGLTFVDAAEDGTITFDKEVLYTQEAFSAEEVLCVHLTADGTIPAYGISYTDADGTVKSFSVNMSGEDGSLYLSAIN